MIDPEMRGGYHDDRDLHHSSHHQDIILLEKHPQINQQHHHHLTELITLHDFSTLLSFLHASVSWELLQLLPQQLRVYEQRSHQLNHISNTRINDSLTKRKAFNQSEEDKTKKKRNIILTNHQDVSVLSYRVLLTFIFSSLDKDVQTIERTSPSQSSPKRVENHRFNRSKSSKTNFTTLTKRVNAEEDKGLSVYCCVDG